MHPLTGQHHEKIVDREVRKLELREAVHRALAEAPPHDDKRDEDRRGGHDEQSR